MQPPRRATLTRRVRELLASLRLRLVWWFVVVMALTTLASVVLARQVLVQGIDARIDAELAQEIEEVRRLADGNDPETGEPFGTRVDRIFDVFLDRNVPSSHEVLLTFIDAAPHRASPGLPFETEDGEHLGALVSDLAAPDRGRLATGAGTLDYLAVPFLVDGSTVGVFVVGIFRDLRGREVDAATLAAAAVGLIMLIIGSALAIRLADRVLRPVRLVTRTARSISETDLSQRIPVRGYDEISDLAATFNDMLDRLESAFATQRRLVDDAGHELRTPITIIGGHLELIGEEPDDVRRTVHLVRNELDRMSRLVDDLLTLARSERPDFLRPEPNDLADLTRQIADKARGLGERAWEIEGSGAGLVMVDAQRLTQAILQLAENAVRHTSPGGSIAIGTAVADGTLRIWVRDDGAGIAADDLDRIFDRFYRGRGRRRSDGSGLGLSIVQAIAEGHGGRVEVISRPNDGATFTIVLPARAAPRSADLEVTPTP
jgi:signal transduction histidine kinase